MRLTAPSAVNMPDGKYGSVRAISISWKPFSLLNSSSRVRYGLFCISFSAESLNIVRIRKKLKITPVVSASHDTMIPGTTPKSTPFAVEMKMDGKKPRALTRTSRQKLNSIAQTPKERI